MAYHSTHWRWPQPTDKTVPVPRYRAWRWKTTIKKHFRVLDQEDVYDEDDFFKIELRYGPPEFEYVSPGEAQRLANRKRAHAKALRVVAEIEQYKQCSAWRKRLQRAKNEFDFVFEPYRAELKKKYGRWWRQEFPIAQAKKRAAEDRAAYKLQVAKDLAELKARGGPEPTKVRIVPTERQREGYAKAHKTNRERHALMAVAAINTLNEVKEKYGILWGRSPEPDHIRICYPYDDIRTFVHEPILEVGDRLDYFGLKWKYHIDDEEKGWLIVEWPAERILRWIDTYIKCRGFMLKM